MFSSGKSVLFIPSIKRLFNLYIQDIIRGGYLQGRRKIYFLFGKTNFRLGRLKGGKK